LARPRLEFSRETIPTLSETIVLCSDLGWGVNSAIKPKPGEDQTTAMAVITTARSMLGRHCYETVVLVVLSSVKPEAQGTLQRAGPH
jgi:hypothetical protein